MSGMLFLKCGKEEISCSARELMTYDWEGWTPNNSVLLQWPIEEYMQCVLKEGTTFGYWRLQTLYYSVYPGRNLPQHFPSSPNKPTRWVCNTLVKPISIFRFVHLASRIAEKNSHFWMSCLSILANFVCDIAIIVQNFVVSFLII